MELGMEKKRKIIVREIVVVPIIGGKNLMNNI